MQEFSSNTIDCYTCSVCGFMYDEESAERTPEDRIIPFTELDSEWTCPGCGVPCDLFMLSDQMQ